MMNYIYDDYNFFKYAIRIGKRLITIKHDFDYVVVKTEIFSTTAHAWNLLPKKYVLTCNEKQRNQRRLTKKIVYAAILV